MSQDLSKITTISSKDQRAYKWHITVEINSESEINFLKSPSHDVKINYFENNKKAIIELDHSK